MKKWRPFCVKPVIAERRSQTVVTPRFFGRSVGVDELRISSAVSHKHLSLFWPEKVIFKGSLLSLIKLI